VLGSAGASPSQSTELTAAEAAKQLENLRKHQKQLASLRKKAAERLDEETARVTHLEEHQRRLEHELAQLHITLERLEEAEQQQNVDQQTADDSLKRLKQLIADTQKQLDEARAEAKGKKSYAIVPYQGKNGTHRRPIYIECRADAVIIQPEGIELTPWDFKGPIRSGNPLASAIRAAREELNQRAQRAGQQELPDAYPLILVRPGAAQTYRAVVTAVDSWDVQYGYELIEADWELEFPEQDPGLAQIMTHAVEHARQRQALLAKAAPRTYSSVPSLSSSEGFAPGSAQGSREHGDANRGQHASGIQTIQTPGMETANKGGSASNISFADEVAANGAAGGHGQAGSGGQASSSQASDSDEVAGSALMAGPAPPGASMTQAAGASAGGASTSSAGLTSIPAVNVHNLESTARGGGHTISTSSSLIQAATQAEREPPTPSAAITRGANWANDAAKNRAAPITRPIRVLVTQTEMTIVPEEGNAAASSVLFTQSTGQVLDGIAGTVKHHIEGWGLAGTNMYWRPMLVLEVAPGAERHAIRIRDLLRDSGVDVRFQDVETAARPSQEATGAAR
jgi:hypothetical protein